MTAKIALKIVCLHSECIPNAKLAVHFGKGNCIINENMSFEKKVVNFEIKQNID